MQKAPNSPPFGLESSHRRRGETGRRERLRISWCKPWGFESLRRQIIPDPWRAFCTLSPRRCLPMARSIWKGSLAFGLVNIPIELYSAIRDHRPKFRLLHAKDEAPVRYERVCQTEGKPVAWDELVKGYEYEKGQFVVLTQGRLQDSRPREDQDDRHPRLRGSRRDRRAVLRDAVLPAAGQRGRSLLRAPSRGDSRIRRKSGLRR